MAHAELAGMALEELHLLLGEDDGVVLGMGFQAHQALVAGLEVVAQPHTAHPGGADVDLTQAQLVGDALGPVGRELQ